MKTDYRNVEREPYGNRKIKNLGKKIVLLVVFLLTIFLFLIYLSI